MLDAAPTLAMPEGTDIAAYGASLLQRFSNAACITAPGRLRWTARRNCRSGCSPPCRTGCGWAFDRHACARGRGLDALRHRQGRTGTRHRRARSASGNWPIASPSAPARSRSALPALLEVHSILGTLGSDPRMRKPSPRHLKTLRLGCTANGADVSAGMIGRPEQVARPQPPCISKFKLRRQQRPGELVIGIGKPVDDIEMSAAGFFDRAGFAPCPIQMLARSAFGGRTRALGAAHPARHPHSASAPAMRAFHARSASSIRSSVFMAAFISGRRS